MEREVNNSYEAVQAVLELFKSSFQSFVIVCVKCCIGFWKIWKQRFSYQQGSFLAFLDFWKAYFQGIGVTFCLTDTERDGICFSCFVSCNSRVGSSRKSYIQSVSLFI